MDRKTSCTFRENRKKPAPPQKNNAHLTQALVFTFVSSKHRNVSQAVMGFLQVFTFLMSMEATLCRYICPRFVLTTSVSSAGLIHMVTICWLSAGGSTSLYGSEGIWHRGMKPKSLLLLKHKLHNFPFICPIARREIRADISRFK